MTMTTRLTSPHPEQVPRAACATQHDTTIGTRVWLEEYVVLQALHDSAANCSPKFRLPDLISACVSRVFSDPEPAARIFTYLHTELVLRDPDHPRRQEAMWLPQYYLLLALQRSPANAHPHPHFQLDHFTTACVALSLSGLDAGRRILDQARKNTAERARAHTPPPTPGG